LKTHGIFERILHGTPMDFVKVHAKASPNVINVECEQKKKKSQIEKKKTLTKVTFDM
jgi:hypothetical protein